MSNYASLPNPAYQVTTPTPTPVVTSSQSSNFSVDGKEIVIRIIKYILEGLMVGIAVALIPKKGAVSMEEILTISLVASATFSLLDMFAPSISNAARTGSGIGIGAGIVGGIPIR